MVIHILRSTLEYRPGKVKGNTGLMSCLPLPATEADNHQMNVRLSDPADVHVYLIGASGVRSLLQAEPMGSRLEGMEELDLSLF